MKAEYYIAGLTQMYGGNCSVQFEYQFKKEFPLNSH